MVMVSKFKKFTDFFLDGRMNRKIYDIRCLLFCLYKRNLRVMRN